MRPLLISTIACDGRIADEGLIVPAARRGPWPAASVSTLLLHCLALALLLLDPPAGLAAPPADRKASGPVMVVDSIAALERATLLAGATIELRAGRYKVNRLVLPPHTTLTANKGAEIEGELVVQGPQALIRGITFIGGMIDISNSRQVTIAECRFLRGKSAIKMDNASGALIINNDFHEYREGVITGWGLDHSTASGNHFFASGQPLNLQFNADRRRGRNIVIERNIFVGTTRMPVEVGPIGASTENLIVRNNWAEDFRNQGPDPGSTMSTFVAYSIVPTYGVNSLITNNYAIAGPNGRGRIGIELDGSGEITGNITDDFDYGAIVYGTGFNVHRNVFRSTKVASVLNYAKRSGRIDDAPASLEPPRRPERTKWSP